MDNSKNVEDIEAGGNIIPSPHDHQQLDDSVSKDDNTISDSTTEDESSEGNKLSRWSQPLHDALLRRDWADIKQILDQERDAINGPVNEGGDTPLLVAMREALGMTIIRKLVNRTPAETLKKRDSEYFLNALEWAILYGDVPLAKQLKEKNGDLEAKFMEFWPYIAIRGLREMAFYLYSISRLTPDEEQAYEDENEYFEISGAPGLCDFVLRLVREQRLFASRSTDILKGLIEQPFLFKSGTRLSKLSSIMYSCIRVDRIKRKKDLEPEGQQLSAPQIQSQGHLTVQSSRAKSLSKFYDNANYIQSSRVYQVLRKAFQAVYQVSEKVASIVLRPLVGQIKNIRDLKLNHCSAIELVRNLRKKIDENLKGQQIPPHVHELFFSAIENGISEVVEEMLQLSPYVRTTDSLDFGDDKLGMLHHAVRYRDVEVFVMLYRKFVSQVKKPLVLFQQIEGNNILHVVAQKPRQRRLGAVGSRVVLQIQREIQWYKGVEQLLPPQLRNKKTGDGTGSDKLPIEIFEEEHQDMVRSDGEWMISMANSCIVGGSLIAAVVFAAAITVPGGNNSHGSPNFSKQIAFRVFSLSDTCALVSSVTAVMIFLSIYTNRHSTEDFLYDLPNRVIIGLIHLLLSLTFMMIAFTATVYLVFSENHHWIIYPTAGVTCIPVILFAYLQLPSLLNMIRTTYGGRNVFKRLEELKSNDFGNS